MNRHPKNSRSGQSCNLWLPILLCVLLLLSAFEMSEPADQC
jgi:hypothetical protein